MKTKEKLLKNDSFITNYKLEVKKLKERAKMLKEEKISILLFTENTTAEIETIEELLRNYSSQETYRQNDSLSFQSEKHNIKTLENVGMSLESFNYEIDVINQDKITKRLFSYFKEQNFEIEENSFVKVCSQCLSLVKGNTFKLEIDDFFHLFTKRLFDLIRATDNNNKIDIDVIFLIIV